MQRMDELGLVLIKMKNKRSKDKVAILVVVLLIYEAALFNVLLLTNLKKMVSCILNSTSEAPPNTIISYSNVLEFSLVENCH